MVSDNFYFTSDYLSESAIPEDIPEYKICGSELEFEIKNCIDSLRTNAEAIKYTVSASDGGTLSSNGGTLIGGTENCAKIKLTYSGAEVEKEITVTVTSSSRYVKELKAKFIFAESVMRYEITDSAGSYYAELYIHTANEAKAVTVNWNKTELLIDETNDYVIGNENLNADKNTASVSIDAYTTVKIVFFKNDITKDYSYALTKFDGTITMPTSSGS